MTGERDDGDGGGETLQPSESRFERRAWVAAYVAVMLILAAGAARRLWAMF